MIVMGPGLPFTPAFATLLNWITLAVLKKCFAIYFEPVQIFMRILAHFTAYKSCVKIWIFTSSSDVYLEKPELILTNIDPLGSIKESKIRKFCYTVFTRLNPAPN